MDKKCSCCGHEIKKIHKCDLCGEDVCNNCLIEWTVAPGYINNNNCFEFTCVFDATANEYNSGVDGMGSVFGLCHMCYAANQDLFVGFWRDATKTIVSILNKFIADNKEKMKEEIFRRDERLSQMERSLKRAAED
jgi:hypothetical protein